jgi:hypothetical protein
MMSKFFKELKQALEEMAAHRRGELELKSEVYHWPQVGQPIYWITMCGETLSTTLTIKEDEMEDKQLIEALDYVKKMMAPIGYVVKIVLEPDGKDEPVIEAVEKAPKTRKPMKRKKVKNGA